LEKPVPSVHTPAGGTTLTMQNDLSSMVVRPSTCPPMICLP
jgi:hypothetical protein